MEFFRSGSGKRIPKRQILNKAVSVSILFTLVLAAAASGGCGLTFSKETPDENERFGAYTDELFRNEISSDTVSLRSRGVGADVWQHCDGFGSREGICGKYAAGASGIRLCQPGHREPSDIRYLELPDEDDKKAGGLYPV